MNLEFQYLNGLTYVLRGTGTGSYQSPVTLKFEHQLAKVRVVAKGTAEVRNISIQNVPLTCFIEEGKITGQYNISTGYIPMLRVECEGICTCWEASVGPGIEIQKFNIDAMDCDLNTPVTTQAAALHTITITANSKGTQTIDLSNGDYTINDDGIYYFSGTGNHAIRVTGGANGAAIGGYSPALNSHNPCGDITIHNVTLYAYASNAYLNNLPIGIGSTGTASCGKIEITDAIVHARGIALLTKALRPLAHIPVSPK